MFKLRDDVSDEDFKAEERLVDDWYAGDWGAYLDDMGDPVVNDCP